MQREVPLIVVVENDSSINDLFCEILTDESYISIACLLGDEAYEVIAKTQPDLVLMDMRLDAVETGFSILKMMRSQPNTSNISAIICSADIKYLMGMENDLDELNCKILEKPFQIDTLISLVSTSIDYPLKFKYSA
jgi:two-component system, OmpR family, response regulator VanR